MRKTISLLLLLLFFTLCFGQQHQIKPSLGVPINWGHSLSKGLVGVWLFNEGSGNKVFDLSMNGAEGTFAAAMPAETAWKVGHDGYAVDFDGADDVISLDLNKPGTAINEFTMVAWVKLEGLGSFDTVIGTRNPNLNALMTSSATGNPISVVWNSVGFDTDTGLILNTGEWYFIAGVIRPGGRTVYRNLDSFSDNNANSVQNVRTTWNIGDDEIGDRFDGLISKVYVYERALTDAEIRSLFYEPYAMFEQPLYGRILAAAAAAAEAVERRRFIITNDQ